MKKLQFNSGNDTKFTIGNYYPALDGLRGLAILMIIIHHNFNFLPFANAAWISLDLFFVLSGFLITGILLNKRDSLYFIRNFYARRCLRIFPVYYLSILIFLFILPSLIKYPFSINYFLVNQSWLWLEMQNWLFILKPRGNNNFLNHFWSLALEEQFYLISPWIILFIKPVDKIISLLLSILLLLLAIRIVLWHFQFQNVSYIDLYAFTRIDGLCVGSLLAIIRKQGNFDFKRNNKILALLFLLMVFIVLPSCKIFFHIRLPYLACCLFPAIALFWGLIVWFSIQTGNIIYKIFNNRVLIFFGKISYGLYIFHWPVIRLIQSGIITWGNLEKSVAYNMYISIIATTIAIILATASYYSYEKFFLGLKRYFN